MTTFKNVNSILINPIIALILLLLIIEKTCCHDDYCYVDKDCGQNNGPVSKRRYLLYDVNPPEGFNLRRDVYMRMAILAHNLKTSKENELRDVNLVLPPWSNLVHWTSFGHEPEYIPWGNFFDLGSLKTFAPVIEMYDFFHDYSKQYLGKETVVIDEVYILQHFEDMFKTGRFEDRMEIGDCTKKYQINYFFYNNITSNNVKCLSYHGAATKLDGLLLNSTAKIILVHHAEVALHAMFGDKLYWQARRSMRFNKELRQIATDFRKTHLNSEDIADDTVLPDDWRKETPNHYAKGGPYLSVHLRRRDFLWGRSKEIPTLNSVAKQISKIVEKLNLTTVFIATDSTEEEFHKLAENLEGFKVVRFKATVEVLKKYKDGGVAIIDQIICSYASYFIGTSQSTFSFRIQEEREILGFKPETTFNSFCKDDETCEKPSVWRIVH